MVRSALIFLEWLGAQTHFTQFYIVQSQNGLQKVLFPKTNKQTNKEETKKKRRGGGAAAATNSQVLGYVKRSMKQISMKTVHCEMAIKEYCQYRLDNFNETNLISQN